MNEEEMNQFASEFLYDHFQLDLQIPVVRNNRLRSSYGRYVMTAGNKPVHIEIAGKTLDFATKEVIKGILKHECIHYALHMLGKDLHDGHPLFESLLQKHEAPSTNTLKIGPFFSFQCKQCEKKYETMRKQVAKTPEKYRTQCCQSEIILLGEVHYNGEGT